MEGFGMKAVKYILVTAVLSIFMIWAFGCKTSTPPTVEGTGTTDVGPGHGIVGTEIPGEGLDGTLYGLEDVHFEFDKSSLSPEAQEVLRRNADWLRTNSSTMIEVEGHCDERGTIEYNLALGDRRARSAKDFLVNLGIGAARMRTISYGKEMPMDAGHTEGAWAKNRRAHFTIISK
jgi:peptidoglycan-associated lipoprotein